MKLLLDNNLSYKLCLPLKQHFKEVNHIKSLLSQEADDIDIWNYAKSNDYNILTKDNDFEDWSLLKGCPPKIIHLLCGNQTTLYILNMVVKNRAVIESFINNDSDGCILKLYV